MLKRMTNDEADYNDWRCYYSIVSLLLLLWQQHVWLSGPSAGTLAVWYCGFLTITQEQFCENWKGGIVKSPATGFVQLADWLQTLIITLDSLLAPHFYFGQSVCKQWISVWCFPHGNRLVASTLKKKKSIVVFWEWIWLPELPFGRIFTYRLNLSPIKSQWWS